MCGKGTQTTSQNTSQTATPNPQAMGVYSQLLQRAQGVANTPYQPYPGELVAPVNQQQGYGIANINNYQPAFQTALGMEYGAAQPITDKQIAQYQSPYTQQVVNATQAQFNNQNAQQQQQVLGNAVAQGALGGNRVGIAQAELANQQQLAQAPVIANLQNQGYMTGLNTALTEQQAMQQGAYGVANMANAGLSGANAQIGAGTLEQQTQQAQDTAQYQQYLNALGYPFQTTQWLAGIGTGVGSQMGGTTTGYGQTQAPAPNNIGSELAGAGTLLYGLSMLATGGRVPSFAHGGIAFPDSAPVIPESHHTLRAQQRQLISGDRHVHMFPHGTRELPVPHGMRRVESHSGVFHYNPKKISANKIHHYARGGHEHMLLGLGPYSKDEILHRIAHGEHPVAIVERNEHGHEVRAALGTHSTARHQHQHMSRTKTKHHTLHIEHPAKVLSERVAAHRQSGGAVTNYSQFGSGYGQSVMPYSGGTSFIPGIGITPGHGAPSSSGNAPPPANNSGRQGAGSQQGIGNLAKAMSPSSNLSKYFQGLNQQDQGVALAGQTPGSDEDILANTGDEDMAAMQEGMESRRGGRVGIANYASGGNVEPLPMSLDQMADAFTRLSNAGIMNTNQAKDFAASRMQRLGISPEGVIGHKAPYARGGVAHYDAGGGDDTPYTDTPNTDLPTTDQDIPYVPRRGASGIASAEEIPPNVPMPRERPPEAPSVPVADAGTSAEGIAPNVPMPTPRPATAGVANQQESTVPISGNVPRGIRNNNPGNIEDGPFARSQPGYVGTDGRFARFDNIDNGKAATSALLGSYGNKGVNTLSGIINRWAPAADGNNTNAYIAAVARETGLDPNAPLDMKNPVLMSKVADAIHSHENGMPSGYIDRLATQNYNRSYGALDLPPEYQSTAKAQAPASATEESGIANWLPFHKNPEAAQALMMIGADIMGGGSHYALENIGRGVSGGLGEYYGMKMNEQKLALDAKKLSNELDLHEKQLAQQALIHSETMQQRQQQHTEVMAQKRAEMIQRGMEPKPFYNNETGMPDYTVHMQDGSLLVLGTGRVYKPGEAPPPGVEGNTPQPPATTQPPAAPVNPNAPTSQNQSPQYTTPGPNPLVQPSASPASGIQPAAFNPDKDGIYKYVSDAYGDNPNSPKTYDYGKPGNTLPVQKGMVLPIPAPVGGKDSRTIAAAGEWYALTGKLPAGWGGSRVSGNPNALVQQHAIDAVMNYGNALAASRGITAADQAQNWQVQPLVGKFITGRQGDQTVSLGTAMRHLETFKEYAQAWHQAEQSGNWDIPILNRIRAQVAYQFGQAAGTNLTTVGEILGPEIVKAIGVAGAGGEKDRDAVKALFNNITSMDQANGAVEGAEKLMKGQLQGKWGQAKAAGLSEERFKNLVGEKEFDALQRIDQVPIGGETKTGTTQTQTQTQTTPPARPAWVPKDARQDPKTGTWYTAGPAGPDGKRTGVPVIPPSQ